ncbi:hypothetical protein DFP72DRAFT_47674 [Ephemerocybe angulata]|uniref:F-box domain-containing protein n=1 Tax=Ephemerocybe angulata TaxID=980116 RepID=A0A8H6HFV2_9AGAR|nr:hypothetical protein DFP72DRAFT_47674 [Tulosesus angulatus]
MSTIADSQRVLDLEIGKLEQDLVSLKRRRNGLSPISQLPTELMCKIFHLSIQTIEWARKPNRHEEARRSISHVSHGWRTVALEWPKLWSEIHIRDRTKVENLDLVRTRAKDLPLSIDFDGNTVYGTPGVQDMFRTETERLANVVLYAPIEVLRSLLLKLKACPNTIQSLELGAPKLSDWTRGTQTQMDSFCNFPKLQHLRIVGWDTLFIPPAAFNPTSLTTLEVRFFSLPAANVIRIAGALPIDMQCLEDISLVSNGHRVLSALSSVIRVPSSIRTVTIGAQQGASSQDISLALHHACTNIPSPRFLHINNEFDPSDGTYKMDVCALKKGPLRSQWNTHSSLRLSFFHPPYAGRPPPGAEPYTFPSSLVNPANWLFSALLHIVVTCPLPAPFWKALASVPTLGFIEYRVTHLEDVFYRTLEEGVETDSDQVGAGDRKLYPSLVVIGIRFQQKGLSWGVEFAERLVITLLHKYQGMGPRHFKWLSFMGCHRHLDADTLRLLFSVSEKVYWNGRLEVAI